MKAKRHFERINKLMPEYNTHPQFGPDNVYKPLLVAALAKSVEFNLFLQRTKSKKNAFFFSPFLRGICEDYITLKYLAKHFPNDKDEVCSAYNDMLILESLQAQKTFFDKRNVSQTFLYQKNAQEIIDKRQDTLKAMMAKNGQRKDKIFPSVEHMAVDAGLKGLYDFIYHATSRMVHFSPNILLRMGWYQKPDDPILFSSHNFQDYYHGFNAFYAAYLFVEFAKTFKKDFGFKKDFMDEVKSIEQQMMPYSFHPELVTFEELNKKRPSNIMTVIFEQMMKAGLINARTKLPKGKPLIVSEKNTIKT